MTSRRQRLKKHPSPCRGAMQRLHNGKGRPATEKSSNGEFEESVDKTPTWMSGFKKLFTLTVAVGIISRTIFAGHVRVVHGNSTNATDNFGGWKKADDSFDYLNEDICNIEKIFADAISEDDFEEKYRYKKPVILKFHDKAKSWTSPNFWSRQYLLDNYADREILIGRGLDIVMEGGSGYMPQTFGEFLGTSLGKDPEDPMYLFDRDFLQNTALLDSLRLPAYLHVNKTDDFDSIFIVGTTSSGVSFHKHADGWNGVVFGRKKWYIYPKETTPPGGDWPSYSQQDWVHRVYTSLTESQLPYECTQEAGEVIYIPEGAYHATLNIGDTVGFALQRKVGHTRVMRLFDEVSATYLNEQPNSSDNVLKRIKLYEQLADTLPENTEVMVKHADSLVLNGELDKALVMMEKVVAMDRFNARAFVGLAKIYSELGRHHDADGSFQNALHLNPESAVIYAEYGIYLIEQRRFRDALHVYETASDKWRDEEEFLIGLFKMQEFLGQVRESHRTKLLIDKLRREELDAS